MLEFFITLGVGFITIFFLIPGFRILIPALRPVFSKKQMLDGMSEEDGWADSENGIDVKRAGTGLGLIIFPFLWIGVLFLYNELTIRNTPNTDTAREACKAFITNTIAFKTSKGRLPKTVNELVGRLDDDFFPASHTVGQKPTGSYRNYYFCYYVKPDPKTEKTGFVGIYAYPAKYSKSNNLIFYRTNESETTYQADIRELYPNVRYGNPVPLFKDFIHENDLPSAFKPF
jgi:hypothetical protein